MKDSSLPTVPLFLCNMLYTDLIASNGSLQTLQ